MAVAMLAGAGLPRASAAPGDPVTPVNHLLVDAPEASATIASPGGTASLTTNMETVLVNPKVDIVFVLDTTQSMQPRIDQLSQGLSQFVQNVNDAGGVDVAIGVYVFGDFGCANSVTGKLDTFTWVTPLTPLSSTYTPADVADTMQHGLPVNGGCDVPEQQTYGGYYASTTAAWRDGAQRELVLLSDISAHNSAWSTANFVNGQAPTLTNWKAYVAANGINVNVVNASGTPGVNAPPSACDLTAAVVSMACISAQFGSDWSVAPTTPQGYVDALTNAIVYGSGAAPTLTIVPSVTVTYADGTPSTDLTAVLDPPSASTTVGATPVAFTLHAVAPETPSIARPGATTTAYVEFVEQGTGSIVARQTVTFRAPNNQTARVVFVDDDNSGSPVAPVAGFGSVYTGLPGTAVGFTEALARSGVPSGYEFVSLVNVSTYDSDDTADQTITVHVKHALGNGALTSTRTIHYTGAGSFTPGDLPQTISWDSVTDAVSQVTTYTARSAAYPAQTSPVIPGYTADIPSVAALSVVSPTTTAPVSSEVTVTYTANTQVVTVVFVDDGAAGAPVTPVAGFVSRLTGPSGSAVGFTQADAETGIPSGYGFVSLVNVSTYDFDDAADQTITVHLGHRIVTGTLPVTRTIDYRGAGASTPADVVQLINWTVTTDAVTDVTVYSTDATGYAQVTVPVLTGLTADKTEVAFVPVAARTDVKPVSTTEVVTYTRAMVQTGGYVPASGGLVWLTVLLMGVGAVGAAGACRVLRRAG